MNKNKKYLTWIIIIIILIIIASIIYTALKPETDAEDPGALGTQKPIRVNNLNQNIPQISERTASQSSSQPTPAQPISNSVPSYETYKEILNSLDKTKCNEIENEEKKTFCINGINLIEKAIAANDIRLCFDPSIKIEATSIIICQQKISNLKK